MKSTVDHHLFGQITVSQTWRAKRISISVKPPGEVRLSLPYNVPLSEAMSFVDQKAEWIQKHLEGMKDRAAQNIISTPYKTKIHSLRLATCSEHRIVIRVTDNEIAIIHPGDIPHTDERVQNAIKKGIEEAWRSEAKRYLPERVETLSRQFGLPIKSVTVRNTVSKWGSCSARNDLSLSLHLMRLPDHLIDYVLTHELCHVKHKNHGPKFHELLDRLTGGKHRELNRELKQYHTRW